MTPPRGGERPEGARESGPGKTAIVIGASAAGLASAASLKARGVPLTLLEKAPHVGVAWRHHYERLHLHTNKGNSSLPGLDWPAGTPRYPSREQVVEYLEAYAKHHGLTPSYDEAVTRIAPEGEKWAVTTPKRTLTAEHVVLATGYTRVPLVPSFPGQETFGGEVLHSSRYTNGARFTGQRVLVVGFGNSGGEIAIDLVEHGAHPTLAVRSRVNVIPRELLGLPILAVSGVMRAFPPKVADALSAPLLAFKIGDITKLGLRKQPYGPMQQIAKDGRIPLIDIGTLQLIREGKVKVAPGLERFEPGHVVFEGGEKQPFDAVVLATGYTPGLDEFLAPEHQAKPGLHRCGFLLSTRGMLNEIRYEAEAIAERIAH